MPVPVGLPRPLTEGDQVASALTRRPGPLGTSCLQSDVVEVAAQTADLGRRGSRPADLREWLLSTCRNLPAFLVFPWHRCGPEVTTLLVVPLNAAALSQLWAQSWPALRPIGHEVRDDHERWVRFHALPESKRYPEDEQEYAEVLRRHNVLLGELVSRTSPRLLVMTVAWSDSVVPTAREEALTRAVTDAELWTSVLREKDVDDERWTHVYVTSQAWQHGVLDPLLRLVADEETADVIVTDDRLRWLVHPYDGGIDIVTRSTQERDQLRDHHSDWLSSHPGGL